MAAGERHPATVPPKLPATTVLLSLPADSLPLSLLADTALPSSHPATVPLRLPADSVLPRLPTTTALPSSHPVTVLPNPHTDPAKATVVDPQDMVQATATASAPTSAPASVEDQDVQDVQAEASVATLNSRPSSEAAVSGECIDSS